jgi:sugar lactone lactonase YvrE
MTLLASLTQIPTLLIDARCALGEGPRWHAMEQRLYWVDIAANALHRWDAVSGAHDTRLFDAPVACFAFRAEGGFVLGMKNGCALMDSWDSQPVPFGPQPLTGMPHHRMNDGRTDPWGNFWVGSVNSAKDIANAGLFRLTADGMMTEAIDGLITSNGVAFTPDGQRLYHADTPTHAVNHYRILGEDGAMSMPILHHQFPHGNGRPDGGSVDIDGCYWTALFDGGCVVRLSPHGGIVQQIALPVQRPTMIAFGGDDGCTAFVTSARTGLDADALAAQPGAGGVFAFKVDVPGVPEWAFGS